MKQFILSVILFILFLPAFCQPIPQIKKDLESTPDPMGYVKNTLKKKFKIDTVTVVTTASFVGLEDSIAYNGKQGKVYGPFKKANCLLMVLGQLPNTFYHVSHILLDTTTFKPKFADSLANRIIHKITSGSSSFESMARTYSSDNASIIKGGDLGWFIRGIMLPQLDRAIANHKKGEIFKVWTAEGLHVVSINDDPKKDIGYALLLRIML